MSQPGIKQRSGVYTYEERSGRTCLNQEWNGGVVSIHTRSGAGEHVSTRNGTEERCLKGYRVQDGELKGGKIIEAE
jgi:hypothetical protein